MPTLSQGMAYLTRESHMLAGLAIARGSLSQSETAFARYTDETIFDLASLTKAFTGLSVMKLREAGRLSLADPLGRFDGRFRHLKEMTVQELMAFACRLVTPGRIDEAPSPQAARELLFAAEAQPHLGGRCYSDIHALALKYVIEAAAGMAFFDYLSHWLLKPLGMTRTFAHVPEALRPLCASCDNEHRIEGERYFVRRGVAPGTVHDPKARALSLHGEDLCGHAGLFSTLGDLTRLCRGLLSGDVLPPAALREMAVNRTGRPLEAGYSQYLGYQCFVKHPDQRHSEVPPYMGKAAVAWSGFTGHHLSLDIEKGLFCVMLGNRVENRLTVLLPPPGKTLGDYGLNPDGSGRFCWPDGEKIWSSVHYVYQKDARLHQARG